VLTVGVDLAAQPSRTAVAWLDWSAGGCAARDVRLGCDDDVVVEALLAADKSGVDCPLGWPVRFVEFVAAHDAGHVEVPAGADWRRELTLRLTDFDVRERVGMTPLSVSADKIGHVAMRCAALLARLALEGRPVDRAGGGPVVEVYPAASLRLWKLDSRNYKRAANLAGLGRLVDALLSRADWLDLGPYERLCRASDDATDAVVAALTARAAALGHTLPPGEDQLAVARVEGWIALPYGGLAALLQGVSDK
jgi:predicted nuclease with RNAse H fold